MKWIAVVTMNEARIFDGKTYAAVSRLRNLLGRERNRALSTGKPGLGRGKSSVSGTRRYSLTGEKNPHEQAATAFAKRVAQYLTKQFDRNHFEELLIVAEPKMHGRLRLNMEKKVLKVTDWDPRDLGKLSAHKIKLIFNSPRRPS